MTTLLVTKIAMPRFQLRAILFAFLLVGCNSEPAVDQGPTAPSDVADTPSALANEEAATDPWISRPTGEWPQLLLTNAAEFNGHTSLEGASGFLVKNSAGKIFAATALHLLGDAGGVEPEVTLGQLDDKLVRWQMFPRTSPETFVEIAGLGSAKMKAQEPNWFGNYATKDWLLLAIASSDDLPAEPLAVRKEPVTVGEEVYFVGCPYSEEHCSQNVYRGKVTSRRGSNFRCDIDPPVELWGFSGAPVLDRDGLVVGVTTLNFQPKMDGDLFLESGGQDVALVYELIEQPD